MTELNRNQILSGSYIWPGDLVELIPTYHVLDRLSERSMGLDCLPTRVRVTRDNIYSGKTNDGVHLHSVVVRLDYTRDKYLFICLNPFEGVMKTIWFENAKSKRNNRGGSQQTV